MKITAEDLRNKLVINVPQAKIKEWQQGDETATLDRMIIWFWCYNEAICIMEDGDTKEMAEWLRDGLKPVSIEKILDFINGDEDMQKEWPEDLVKFYKD